MSASTLLCASLSPSLNSISPSRYLHFPVCLSLHPFIHSLFFCLLSSLPVVLSVTTTWTPLSLRKPPCLSISFYYSCSLFFCGKVEPFLCCIKQNEKCLFFNLANLCFNYKLCSVPHISQCLPLGFDTGRFLEPWSLCVLPAIWCQKSTMLARKLSLDWADFGQTSSNHIDCVFRPERHLSIKQTKSKSFKSFELPPKC